MTYGLLLLGIILGSYFLYVKIKKNNNSRSQGGMDNGVLYESSSDVSTSGGEPRTTIIDGGGLVIDVDNTFKQGFRGSQEKREIYTVPFLNYR